VSIVRLPSVDWIFIHPLQVVAPAAGDVVVDDEGRWSEPAATPVTVNGYLAVASRAEFGLAEARGVDVQAVAAFPRTTALDERCEVVAAGIDPHLDGRYRITAVIPTAVHLRALLVRTVGHDESQLTREP
jgi:hypothetical protein